MSVELWNNVVKAAGGVPDPENTLETTLMRNVINACGGNCDNLPDNLKSTLLVAMADAVASSAVEEETKTISPDFSGGDVVVTPTEGKLLSEVTVQKPETLVPENIAKDVDIAGVVGTLETGGGGEELIPPFAITVAKIRRFPYKTSETSYTDTVSCKIPANATILRSFGSLSRTTANTDTEIYTSYTSPTGLSGSAYDTTVVQDSDNITVSHVASSTYVKYAAALHTIYVLYTLPYIYITGSTDGKYNVRIEPGFTGNVQYFSGQISTLEFADGWTDYTNIDTAQTMTEHVILPPSYTNVSMWFYGTNTVSFARHTAVPVLAGVNRFVMAGFQTPTIEVPAALYDEWIAADQWSDISDRIVAV